MAASLETQEIIFAFAADNKDNIESWGKYKLDELEKAYAELPEEEINSKTGHRIKERIAELASGHDQVKEALPEVDHDKPLDDSFHENETMEIPIMDTAAEVRPKEESSDKKTTEAKPKTPMIIAGAIIGVVIMLLLLNFF
ncbi:MAG: hypothetical protein ACI9ZT_000605 [Gammaproteobacteria bacterium]|jgi:hypothetical protein